MAFGGEKFERKWPKIKLEEKDFEPLTDKEIEELRSLEGPYWADVEKCLKFKQEREAELSKLSEEERKKKIEQDTKRKEELKKRAEKEWRYYFSPSSNKMIEALVHEGWKKYTELQKEAKEATKRWEKLTPEQKAEIKLRRERMEGYEIEEGRKEVLIKFYEMIERKEKERRREELGKAGEEEK